MEYFILANNDNLIFFDTSFQKNVNTEQTPIVVSMKIDIIVPLISLPMCYKKGSFAIFTDRI